MVDGAPRGAPESSAAAGARLGRCCEPLSYITGGFYRVSLRNSNDRSRVLHKPMSFNAFGTSFAELRNAGFGTIDRKSTDFDV